MTWTFVSCVGIALLWLILFYLWGRSYLSLIGVKQDIASSIPFGYLILSILYQIVYIPFFLSKSSYRATAYIWMGIVGVTSVGLFFYLRKTSGEKKIEIYKMEKAGVFVAAALILCLAFFISLHVPFYGSDTVYYLSTMNDAYYQDSMWIREGVLNIHNGLSSIYHFFTISSLLTGIRPYYISLFSVRIVGVCLFALIMYRTGKIVFQKEEQRFCWSALILAVLVPTSLLFWGSQYTAEFFYWRIYEGKGFCQFILLPIGFSVFLDMFKTTDRKSLWQEERVVGLAAMAVSASSMTPYIFLVLIGSAALLTYDKLKVGWKTIGSAAICSLPNFLYLVFYLLTNNGTLVF